MKTETLLETFTGKQLDGLCFALFMKSKFDGKAVYVSMGNSGMMKLAEIKKCQHKLLQDFTLEEMTASIAFAATADAYRVDGFSLKACKELLAKLKAL